MSLISQKWSSLAWHWNLCQERKICAFEVNLQMQMIQKRDEVKTETTFETKTLLESGSKKLLHVDVRLLLVVGDLRRQDGSSLSEKPPIVNLSLFETFEPFKFRLTCQISFWDSFVILRFSKIILWGPNFLAQVQYKAKYSSRNSSTVNL